MTSMNPYLNFAGNAREALEFYKKLFGGEVTTLTTYGDGGMAQDESMKNRVMHSEFKADGVFFMASDAPDNTQPHSDNNISLSLNFTDVPEQTRVFNALAQGGAVTMPLDISPWGTSFGMLTDKYGIQWLLSCNVPQQ